ncbi:amidase [Perlucidibaca aquatica]|uniref:amidase n=1 Tax=Perlucidibaca aquatica TaxID=1852776 RepID=UPI00083B929A|nr:amidase [Perlucidibaca aquatica]
MSDLLHLSATQLAARIRSGEVSSAVVVEAHIERLRQVNPIINAVVVERIADARVEAANADREIAAARAAGTLDQLPPFLGVPCTIKESFHFAGMPNTSGLVSRVGLKVAEDAPTVARLRAAGAIPLGVTNTSEVCMWMESYNHVYGLSRNPYDPSRTVGGSSGGEGAIVGSAASPFGLGGDVGGSIRMPAFFNGVFGHKCSPGLVPNEGQFPGPSGNIDRHLSTGPLCRRAEDLEPLLRIMAGDGADQLKPVGDVDVSRLRVLQFARELAISPDADQMGARDRAVQALMARGARVEAVHLPLMAKARDLWTAMLATAGSEHTFADHLFGSRSPVPALKEFGKLALKRSDHTFPLVVLALFERLPELTPARTAKLRAEALTLKAQLEDLLGDDGVLITPTYPTVAPKHHKALLPPFNFVNCAVFNALSLPVTAVPTGLNAAGVPTGVQVVAKEGNDHLTLAAALALETALGGWAYPVVQGAVAR